MSCITVRGARLHNLRNVSLSIPKDKLVVFTGPSGSGKSSLAFDTLHVEGQRQYMESLGMVAYGGRPPVDGISGLSPSISVAQGLANRSPRSTVGTATEVFTSLRVLFARAGHRPCPQCGRDVPPGEDDEGRRTNDEGRAAEGGPGDAGGEEGAWDEDSAGIWGARAEGRRKKEEDDEAEAGAWVACPHCGARLPAMDMAFFSFNKPEGACPTCTGLGVVYAPDLRRLLDEERSILDGAVQGWNAALIAYHTGSLAAAARHYGLDFDPARPVRELGPAQRDLLLYGVAGRPFRQRFPHVAPPATVARGRFEGLVTALLRRHAEHAGNPEYLERSERLLAPQVCPDCGGARLRPEARGVTVAGRPLVGPTHLTRAHFADEEARAAGPFAGAAARRGRAQDPLGVTAGAFCSAGEAVSQLPLTALGEWIGALRDALPAEEWLIAAPIAADLAGRIGRLVDVGLGYLTLEQAAPSLSAGEALRLRLASLLGSGLTGVLYVLDEPTIGLHPRDTPRLVGMLRALAGLGNTVLVIEHDLALIAAADWVVDFGPGGGRNGGRIMAQGTPEQVAADPQSPTGRCLAAARLAAGEAQASPVRRRCPAAHGPRLTIHGAREHNLRNITVGFPLAEAGGQAGLLAAVTGVSGSGKSTLLFDILDRAARQRIYGAADGPGDHDAITGWEFVDKVITIDQAPLARSTRSNAATYTGAFDAIREAFAAQPAARAAGLTPRHFSFNAPGGRCERCEGAGVLPVEMHFLPDVLVRCPACRGRRYQRRVLAVTYQGLDIAQVLDLTVEEASALFDGVPAVQSRLALLVETGLGYLRLGQPASTFSGGEAQRVKLARELSRRAAGRTLYLLDEPTTGLHPSDTDHLLRLLQRLVNAGHTVIVIEHNLDVIRAADWVVDLGPEGGPDGGRVVAEGPPEAVAATPGSHTGALLRRMLA